MIFVVSGEGKTDMGQCDLGQEGCSGQNFSAGPMTVMIDRIVDPIFGFSLLETGCVEFVSETCLAKQSRKLPLTLSGPKREKETAYFFKNARALARIAQERSKVSGIPTGAVLFRDADGTNSTEADVYERKWRSMEQGFLVDGFEFGVPMIPNPKSEAWILCALKEQPYQNCSSLENYSGNDAGMNSLKEQLEERLNQRRKDVDDLPEMVRDGSIDVNQIQMPSFQRFRERLENVSRSMLSRGKE